MAAVIQAEMAAAAAARSSASGESLVKSLATAQSLLPLCAVRPAAERELEEGEVADVVRGITTTSGGKSPSSGGSWDDDSEAGGWRGPLGGTKRPHGHADGRWSPASPVSSVSSSSASWQQSRAQQQQHQVPTRDMPMEFWVRTEECKRLKTEHLDFIDRHYSSREQFIEDTVFCDPMTGAVRDTVLEPNMFPYDTPPEVEHWTLWSREDMSHEEIEAWVTEWLMANKPHVRRWNYDDNAGDRSIYWFHVHVYLQYDDLRHARPRLLDGEAERDAESRSRYKRSRRSRSPAPEPDPCRRRRGLKHAHGDAAARPAAAAGTACAAGGAAARAAAAGAE